MRVVFKIIMNTANPQWKRLFFFFQTEHKGWCDKSEKRKVFATCVFSSIVTHSCKFPMHFSLKDFL